MITIICGTNRQGNEAAKFSKKFLEIFNNISDEKIKLLELENIPHDYLFPEMYNNADQAPSITEIQNEYMIPANKFVFVIPEYNGSFPGVLKLFLDACSIRFYKETFKGKKAALCGVASGRAGNLRGIDHLTGVMHHVGTTVMPYCLPISSIENLLNNGKEINDTGTIKIMEDFANAFIKF